MARSNRRSRRRGSRRGGLLVRESIVQKLNPESGIYSVPAHIYGCTAGYNLSARKGQNSTVELGWFNQENNGAHMVTSGYILSDPVCPLVRMSSMVVSSDSPLDVLVRTPNGGWVTHHVLGEKPCKITFSRENSIVGNSVALKTYKPDMSASVGEMSHNQLIVFRGVDPDTVFDIQYNCCLDSTMAWNAD